MTIDDLIANIKAGVEYNSSDLGEFGKVIKLVYLNNILDREVQKYKLGLKS